MDGINIYKEAARVDLQFPYRGNSSVHDLFQIDLEKLSDLHVQLTAAAKLGDGESLLVKLTKEDTLLQLRISIVKDIFETKQAEQAKRKEAAGNRARREKILGLMERKGEEALNNKTMEELAAELAAIGE